MHSRTYLRRFKNVNLCCFASRRQLSFLCARIRLTAAISPGDLGFGEGDCANTERALNEIDATTTAAKRRIKFQPSEENKIAPLTSTRPKKGKHVLGMNRDRSRRGYVLAELS